MLFESVEHAYHYASGQQIDIMVYQNKVIDVSEFKLKHPGKKAILFFLNLYLNWMK